MKPPLGQAEDDRIHFDSATQIWSRRSDAGGNEIDFSADTLAGLNSLTTGDGVEVGSVGLITDTGQLAVATSATAIGSSWTPWVGAGSSAGDMLRWSGTSWEDTSALQVDAAGDLQVANNIVQAPGNTAQLGNTTIGNGAAAATLALNAQLASIARVAWQEAGVDLWDVRRENATRDFEVIRRDVLGAFLSLPVRVDFALGAVELGGLDNEAGIDRIYRRLRPARITTTDATTTHINVLSPSGDQRTTIVEAVIRAQRDSGDNFYLERFRISDTRTGGTVTSAGSGSIYGPSTRGTGGTLSAAWSLSGSQRRLSLTGNAGETWQWDVFFEEYESGF